MKYIFSDFVSEKLKKLNFPDEMGSYKKDDCIFVLKDISNVSLELSNEQREANIQHGQHYSTMLPVEYQPGTNYMEVFYSNLTKTSLSIAQAVSIVSKKILKRNHDNVVLVSLARAGTPAGVLIKRYIKFYKNIDCPHYSISIIRDVGIDENALLWILSQHPDKNIQFIDGWTGKGVINKTLTSSIENFYEKYNIKLDSDMAVIADPAYCVKTYGTRDDFLIPSACLNSTVSGLVSRTVYRDDLIFENDFHGAKYYKELSDCDVSNFFIDSISNLFKKTDNDIPINNEAEILNLGIKDVNSIKSHYNIRNINHIKPGIGETTRVLLRRIPWKILVKDVNHSNIKHIIILAKERNVPIEEFYSMNYTVCGLIKEDYELGDKK